MPRLTLSDPVHIQNESGASFFYPAGETFVRECHVDHPRIVARTIGEESPRDPKVYESGSPDSGPARAADQPNAPHDAVAGPADETDLRSLPKDELIVLAGTRGVEIDKRWSASRIVAALEA